MGVSGSQVLIPSKCPGGGVQTKPAAGSGPPRTRESMEADVLLR